jgi:negative regulator of flagellin synthesis FlgM
MEMIRLLRASIPVSTELATQVGTTSAGTGSAVSAIEPVGVVKPGLEAIQQALSIMPQVDLDKVAAIRDALASGEISFDSLALASSMLGYHRGKSE